MEIEQLRVRRILDSRTDITVEAEINGTAGAAPSGASAGSHEASSKVPDDLEKVERELREGLVGRDLTQEEFDSELETIDGTEGFKRIGSCAVACSFAFYRASSSVEREKFPLPLSNVVGGGEHGGKTSIQEFLVVPTGAESFMEALKTNASIYRELRNLHSDKVKGVNDEGALVTSMGDGETLAAVREAADRHDAEIGVDVAANELHSSGKYHLGSRNRPMEPEEMLEHISDLIESFDIFYVEDPFHEDDFELHAELSERYPGRLVCGDDLFTTQAERLQRGVEEGACNSLIVKPNQVGTVSGASKTTGVARENSYVPVVSHRSGETCDHTISDLALDWEVPMIKAGIADIRIAKLNRLLRLWDRADSPEMSELPR